MLWEIDSEKKHADVYFIHSGCFCEATVSWKNTDVITAMKKYGKIKNRCI